MSEGVTAAEEAGAGRYCIGCGYNLRGLQSDRCPECGLPTDTAKGSAISWEGRREIGRFRAFRRTCWEAMFHPRRLARAIGFPVNSRSAKRFQLVVAVLATLPLAISVTITAALEDWSGFFNFLMWPAQMAWPMQAMKSLSLLEVAAMWLAGVTTWCVLPLGIFITIYLWTGMLAFWVRPHDWPAERRDRAAAVSAYVSAPLAMIFIPMIAQAIVFSLWNVDGQTAWRICVVFLGIEYISFLLIFGFVFSCSLKLISAMTHCGWGRWASAWVGLPICWLLAAIIGLGLLPVLLGLIRIMIQSIFA